MMGSVVAAPPENRPLGSKTVNMTRLSSKSQLSSAVSSSGLIRWRGSHRTSSPAVMLCLATVSPHLV
jgi:hypothetical protein